MDRIQGRRYFKYILIAVFTIVLIFPSYLISAGLLDDFSAIYHSNVIIEVAVDLGENGHPRDSCYLRVIKGSRDDLREVLEFFGISRKKRGLKCDQKRLMFFYRNRHGQLRSMNLIRQGVGPYSDDASYKSFVNMVKLMSRRMMKENGLGGGVVIDDNLTCNRLRKNRYFRERYGYTLVDEEFSVGGDAGRLKEFSPLVVIECK